MNRKIQKLFYMCVKRGMQENEIVLRRFAEKYLPSLSHEETDALEKFLNCTDLQISQWIAKPETINVEHDTKVFKLIIQARNEGI